MNSEMFTDKLLSLFEEAKESPNDYINPNYLTELVDVIEAYQGVDEGRVGSIKDYIYDLYGL